MTTARGLTRRASLGLLGALATPWLARAQGDYPNRIIRLIVPYAAQQAVARASQTLRHITGLDVVKSSAVVKDGKIVEYHVNVKLAFIIEGTEIEKP